MPYKNVPEELWGKMDECKEKVMAQGRDEKSAIAICHASIVDGQSAALDFVLSPEVFSTNENFESPLYLVDDFVALQPGEAYRLFPFGTIVKNGKKREITKEFAAKFKLPHFKPPIKLGSHADVTPSGGSLTSLEVREDGLYAVPEYTDKGAEALKNGDYRYHSPEVIWEGGGLEDPQTGEMIPGPLIVGDALLHTPHLGESAALYSVEVSQIREGGDPMSDEKKPSLWDKFVAFMQGVDTEAQPAEEAPAETEQPEQLTALVNERDEYKAKVTQMEAEQAAKARRENFAAQCVGILADNTAPDMLSSMTDEQAAWVLSTLKALSAQATANDVLTQELGTSESTESKSRGEQIEAAIAAYQADHKCGYVTAFDAVRIEHPDLFKI